MFSKASDTYFDMIIFYRYFLDISLRIVWIFPRYLPCLPQINDNVFDKMFKRTMYSVQIYKVLHNNYEPSRQF